VEELRMKLSREKMVQLSHLVVDALDKEPSFEFLADANEVRLRVFAIIQEEVKWEAVVDALARRKITSMRRDVPEGSEEWEVLYRQFYREEMEKRGKVR
jgi:hypothetical protein